MQHERLKLWLFSIMYALFVWPLFASHAPKHSIRGITLAIRDWAVVRLSKTWKIIPNINQCRNTPCRILGI